MSILLATRDSEVIYLARKLRYVKEVPGNHGARVNGIQKWGGGTDGDSWCCYFATMVLDIAYEGKAPIPRTGSCDVVLALAKSEGWLRDEPEPGDLYLVLRNAHDAHHIGIVVGKADNGLFPEVSGNTNDDGSRNGTMVLERPRKLHTDYPGKIVFVHYPRS